MAQVTLPPGFVLDKPSSLPPGFVVDEPIHRKGIGEAFVNRGVEVAKGMGALGWEAAKAAAGGPASQFMFLPKFARDMAEGSLDSIAEARKRQSPKGGARQFLAGVPGAGPYLTNKLSDVEEGDWRKVAGETLFDAATLGIPGTKAGRAAAVGAVKSGVKTVKRAAPLLQEAKAMAKDAGNARPRFLNPTVNEMALAGGASLALGPQAGATVYGLLKTRKVFQAVAKGMAKRRSISVAQAQGRMRKMSDEALLKEAVESGVDLPPPPRVTIPGETGPVEVSPGGPVANSVEAAVRKPLPDYFKDLSDFDSVVATTREVMSKGASRAEIAGAMKTARYPDALIQKAIKDASAPKPQELPPAAPPAVVQGVTPEVPVEAPVAQPGLSDGVPMAENPPPRSARRSSQATVDPRPAGGQMHPVARQIVDELKTGKPPAAVFKEYGVSRGSQPGFLDLAKAEMTPSPTVDGPVMAPPAFEGQQGASFVKGRTLPGAEDRWAFLQRTAAERGDAPERGKAAAAERKAKTAETSAKLEAALAEEKPPPAKPAAKEPWQMTRAESKAMADRYQQIHEDSLASAGPKDMADRKSQLVLEKGKLNKLERQFEATQMPSQDLRTSIEKQKGKVAGIEAQIAEKIGMQVQAAKNAAQQILKEFPDITEPRPDFPFVVGRGKHSDFLIDHRGAVKRALNEGKPVPAEVLADYPDLKPPPAPPADAVARLKQPKRAPARGNEFVKGDTGEPLVLYRGGGAGDYLTPAKAEAKSYATMAEYNKLINKDQGFADLVSEIMAEEGATSITDLSLSTLDDIATGNGYGHLLKKIGEGKLDGYNIKAKNPLDLREMGSSIRDIEKTWDELHSRGLVDKAWKNIDEEFRYEMESAYNGSALYKLLEDENVASNAFKRGYDAVVFEDQGLSGKTFHDTWMVKAPHQKRKLSAPARGKELAKAAKMRKKEN